MFADAFTAFICGLVAWHAVDFVTSEYRAGTYVFEGLPIWVATLILPVGFCAMQGMPPRLPAARGSRAPRTPPPAAVMVSGHALMLAGLILFLFALLGAPLFAAIAAGASLGFARARARTWIWR